MQKRELSNVWTVVLTALLISTGLIISLLWHTHCIVRQKRTLGPLFLKLVSAVGLVAGMTWIPPGRLPSFLILLCVLFFTLLTLCMVARRKSLS